MPYPRELLDAAGALYRAQPRTQANLRRAVSTAYYALFHFLVEETCRNWTRPEQRAKLARVFDHRNMLIASDRRAAEHKNAGPGSNESLLYNVASALSQLQRNRHNADYDLSKTLTASDVASDIVLVEQAFVWWPSIQNEQFAQDYLFSLLFRERP